MENGFKTNLTKVEKILLAIYIAYVLFAKLVYDKFLFSIVILIALIFIAAKRKDNNTDANYLIKEKMELIIRHFFLLCIFWNILFGIFWGELLYEDSITSLIIYVVMLALFLLPFLGILKAISKIQKIQTYKDVELYRELPQKIEPAIIAYLIQDKISDRSDISATLLDLVRREYLIMEENTSRGFYNVSKGILNKKLIKNPKKNYDELKNYEQFLISWFTKSSNNANEIDMNELKNMLKEDKNSKENYDTWEILIKQEADKSNFYDNSSRLSKFSRFSIKWAKKIFLISLVALAFAILIMASEYIVTLPEIIYLIAAFAILVHMGLSTLAIIIYDLRLPEEYLSEKGKENIKKWNGFIKFLKEYTMIDKREAEEVSIWEEYLVYAVALGVAKNTIDNMNEAYGLESYVK